MANDLELLAAANPVSKDESIVWSRSPAAGHVWHEIQDATESEPHVGRVHGSSGPRRVSLLVAAALVIVAAFPIVWWQATGGSPFRSGLSDGLGISHVWPEHPVDLTPAELGRAFATEVLDWSEVDIIIDSRFTEPGDTVVTMTTPDDRFVALLVRDDAGGKVIVRVGAPELYGPHLVYTSRGGNYQWRLAPGSMLHDLPLGISQASAVRVARADVQVRSLDGDVFGPVEVILATEGEPALADGLGDAERIASGLVLYRDTEGEVIGAGGGTFAEGEPLALSPTPSEIRADGHVTQPELWSAVASVVQCVGSTGVEAGGSINLDGEFSFTVESEPGAGPASGGFRPCVAEHLGSVEVAVAFQRTPPGHTESAFYNAVLECVENETGLEFPDVSEPAPERPTSAAIAAAPRVYDACFDDVVAVHPTRLFGFG